MTTKIVPRNFNVSWDKNEPRTNIVIKIFLLVKVDLLFSLHSRLNEKKKKAENA